MRAYYSAKMRTAFSCRTARFSAFVRREALDASGVEDGVEPGVVRAEHDTVAADLAKSYDGVSVAYGLRLVRAVDDEAAVE